MRLFVDWKAHNYADFLRAKSSEATIKDDGTLITTLRYFCVVCK